MIFEGFILISPDKSDLWKGIIPLSVFWFITLLFIIFGLYLHLKFQIKIREFVKLRLNSIGITSQLRTIEIIKDCKIKYKNLITHTFIKYLIGYLLFWIPYILNSNILRSKKFNNEELFTLGAMICFGSFYIKGVYNILKTKLTHLNSEDKVDKYKTIVKKSENQYLLEKLNSEILMNNKKKNFLSENTLTMIFYIFKFFIFVGIGFYFRAIGKKIDDPANIHVSWCVLMIPIFFYFLVLFILIILQSFANEESCIGITKQIVSNLIYYFGFLVALLILGIKLDGALENLSFFIVPGLTLASSIYLIIHNCCISSNKEDILELNI